MAMGERKISRSAFLREGSCLAVAAAGGMAGNALASHAPPALACTGAACGPNCPLAIRPYQLMCLVCSIGEGPATPDDERLRKLRDRIREYPDVPITLRANAGDGFAFQNPGSADDTPGGPDFNQKRDLTILQQLDMPPGETLPARMLIHRMLKLIPTADGICGYAKVTSEDWKGCPKAKSGFYERGHARASNVLFAARPKAEMTRDKQASIRVIRKATAVRIRPHIVVCSICQYGSGVRPPFKEDNLPEMLALLLTDKPDMRLTLVPGADWMICAPCPHRNPKTGLCVTGQIRAGGLYNELKDLNVLQHLGLSYGTTMRARDLYRLILEQMPTVVGVCALDPKDKSPYSVWRDVCGVNPPQNYQKGRELLLAKFK
jgi:hypothetical protein